MISQNKDFANTKREVPVSMSANIDASKYIEECTRKYVEEMLKDVE